MDIAQDIKKADRIQKAKQNSAIIAKANEKIITSLICKYYNKFGTYERPYGAYTFQNLFSVYVDNVTAMYLEQQNTITSNFLDSMAGIDVIYNLNNIIIGASLRIHRVIGYFITVNHQRKDVEYNEIERMENTTKFARYYGQSITPDLNIQIEVDSKRKATQIIIAKNEDIYKIIAENSDTIKPKINNTDGSTYYHITKDMAIQHNLKMIQRTCKREYTETWV